MRGRRAFARAGSWKLQEDTGVEHGGGGSLIVSRTCVYQACVGLVY